jgi:hypothetical protein
MGKRFTLVLIALAVLSGAVQSQEQPVVGADTDPEEYSEQEFSPFLRDLRRAEIIMLGTFPVTLFLSLEAYDIYRFAASGGALEYAPWPFRPPGAVGYTGKENLGMFLAAISTSVLIAAADYIIGRVKVKRELE